MILNTPCRLAALAALLLAALAPLPAGAAPGALAQKVAELDRERIMNAAAKAMALPPITITAHRAKLATGGPNDYYSNGDYWWPDPAKADGLPYIQRDGETNPNNFDFHRIALREMKDAVAALGAAYALSGDDAYAAKAAELLRVFFLDEKTRMNPNLKYAQAIPGRSPGRGIGIIDTLHLAELPCAVNLLAKSPAFKPEITEGLKKWFADYAAWMTTDPNGLDEMKAKNNHSVAYFVQLASFARFTGDRKLLAMCRKRMKEVLLPDQMADDGSFPAELKRTKPYGYSIFQLDNIATLCHILSTPQDDLWQFKMSGDRDARKAVDFLYPYLSDKARWTADGRKPDVQHWESWPARQPALLFAYAEFGDEKYFNLWKKLDPDPKDLEVRRNIAITQPILWIAEPKDVPLIGKGNK